MNESNGSVNTNASTMDTNTNVNKNEVKTPESEVKKQVEVNTHNKEVAVISDTKNDKSVALLVVIAIILAGLLIYYFKYENAKKRNDEMSSQGAAAAVTIPSTSFSTEAATDITSTSANLHATITGMMDTTHLAGQSTYFKYGTSPTNPSTLSVFNGAIEGPLTTKVSELQPDTTYYYRVVINHGTKSAARQREYGEILNFKTLPL